MELTKLQNRKDLFATLLNQMWKFVSGPITMLLIPLFLTEVQQGYWYLFGSIASLSTFADLGFSNIILQFSAHEFAFLSFEESGVIIGDNNHLKKLGSFFRFSLKWLAFVSLVAYPIIFIVGIIYFIRDDVVGIYIIPWIIFSTGSLINFYNNSILSFIEGLNKIEKVQKIRFKVSIINTTIIALLLILHLNIYALAVAMFVSSSTIFVSLFGTFKKVLVQLLDVSKIYKYDWKKEVLPLFTKYALSSITVFFTLYIYTPIMHLYHGPIYSGKVGLSFTIVNAIFGIANIWIYTITPTLNMLVEQKNWKEMDRLFCRRLSFSCITYIFIVFCMIICFKINNVFEIAILQKILSRCFPLWSIMFLAGAYFINIFANAAGVYLTAHKKIPFLIPNIISSIFIFISTIIIAKFLKPEFFFLGTFITYFIFLFVDIVIFQRCRRNWHNG